MLRAAKAVQRAPSSSGRGCVLGTSASSCDRLSGHLAGAGVAEIGLLGTAPRVREIDPHHCAFGLVDFLTAIVADQSRNTCHRFPPVSGDLNSLEPSAKDSESSDRSRLLNSPGTEQAQQGLFLLVEAQVACAYNA